MTEVVESETGIAGAPEAEVDFFYISLPRLVLFNLFTMGIYEFYWFYRNWEYVRDNHREVSPFVRAIFPIFFSYSLFKDIYGITQPEKELSNRAAAWACVFIVFSFCSGLPGMYEFITLLSLVPLLHFQQLVNAHNIKKNARIADHKRITLGQLCFLVLGLIVWVAVFQTKTGLV